MTGRSEDVDTDRYERPWAHEVRMFPALSGDHAEDDPLVALLRERQSTVSQKQPGGFTEAVLNFTRWAVFDVNDDGAEILRLTVYLFDLATAELVLTPALEIGGWENENELKRYVMHVLTRKIPLIAETNELRARLDALVRELLTVGVEADLESKKVRLLYTPTKSRLDFSEVEALAGLGDVPMVSSAEARIALEALREELGARTQAGRVLAALRLAIRELEDALNAATANEAALQMTLTRHPVLFGPEYSRVSPQHPLGREYVMDYALVRSSGLVDLVEIEASTHRLYTQANNPSAALTHAEQQVLDWLAVIRDHAPFFQRDLPELQQPLGYVVIGRDATLAAGARERLRQRNRVYHGTLIILTYDDLLDRARQLLQSLEQMAEPA